MAHHSAMVSVMCGVDVIGVQGFRSRQMPDPKTSPTPDLSLVDTAEMLDEIGRRFDGAVMITTRDLNDATGDGVLGTWVSDGMRHHQVVGLLMMAGHWVLRDEKQTFGSGML